MISFTSRGGMPAKGVPGQGNQDVERYRGNLQLLQGQGHGEAVSLGFSEPEDAAGADFQAGRLGRPDRGHPLVETMGGGDLGKKFPGSFQVVVITA